METNGTLTFSQHFWRSAAMHHLQPRRRPASFGDACLGASRWGWWNAHCDFIQCLSEEEILKCLIWRWGGCLCNCFPPEAVSQMLVSCPHSIMFNSAYSWENKPHSSAISRIRTTIDQGGGRARGGWKTTLREHGRCLKMYNYASARSVPLAPLLFRPSPTSFIIRLPLSSFFFQTVLGVETRSSRVSPSWRWRSSGTSAASDVGRATWSSQESTSASELRKEKASPAPRKNTRIHVQTVRFTHYSVFFFFCSYSLYLRDGVPYCEADYHAQYGVKCETCSRYISGRVLEVRTGDQISTPNGVNVGIQARGIPQQYRHPNWELTVVAGRNQRYQNWAVAFHPRLRVSPRCALGSERLKIVGGW